MTATGATVVRRGIGRLVAAALLVVGVTRVAGAQYMSVSGSPLPLAVNTTVGGAGSAPTVDIDASTTYTILVLTSRKQDIVAQLNTAMPSGVTLSVTLDAPTGATSAGAVVLGTSARTVINDIPTFSITTKAITYRLQALITAGVIPQQQRKVTFTIITAA